jgi:formylglycine-generating enzyme required for sulfatase activity
MRKALLIVSVAVFGLSFGCGSGKDAKDKPAAATGADFTEKVYGTELDMVFVQGGTFLMGCTEECSKDAEPARSVTVKDFFIGKTEVTQGLWKTVMGNLRVVYYTNLTVDSTNGLGDNYPMYFLSWDNAQEFIVKLRRITGKYYRLPTETEWEYAARGGNKSKGYMYSGSNNIGDVAWYHHDSFTVIHLEKSCGGCGYDGYYHGGNNHGKLNPVGAKQANELGIHDMSGNVREWTSDSYDGESYRVLRGGDWIMSATGCRVSYRSYDSQAMRSRGIGFRLALDP